jgi:hypothetical protein
MSSQISSFVLSGDRSLRYLLVVCSLVVAIFSILLSIKVSAATIWSDVAPSKETINRTRKGDRLPLALAADPSPADRPIELSVPRLAAQHSLPDGCEALASPLARSAVVHIAGRCVS